MMTKNQFNERIQYLKSMGFKNFGIAETLVY